MYRCPLNIGGPVGPLRRTTEQKLDDARRHLESVERILAEGRELHLGKDVDFYALKTRWFAQLKHRAKKQNLPFNLNAEHFTLPEFCPILGIKLTFNTGQANDNSYSMDRIDNTRGYIADNVQIISYKANRFKSSATLDELIKLGKWAQHEKTLRTTT